MRFDPRLLIWSSTRACAPPPTATIVITAPTPMMMPSMVSIERSLLTRSAVSATLSVAKKFMGAPARCARSRREGRAFLGAARRKAGRRLGSGLLRRHERRGVARHVRRIADEPAVAERQQTRGERGDVLLVRDDDDRDAAAIELLQQRHDFEARRGVERARRLVGEDELGVVDQRAGDGHALLLPARQLRRDCGARVPRAPPARASRAPWRAGAPPACPHRGAAARRSPAPTSGAAG